MCKENKTLNVRKSLLHVVLVLIFMPALVLLAAGCNPFGKCGKPGYTLTGSCGNITVAWDCSDPCSPSISSKTYTQNVTFNTDTVYCEDDSAMGYDTSEGIYLRVTCP